MNLTYMSMESIDSACRPCRLLAKPRAPAVGPGPPQIALMHVTSICSDCRIVVSRSWSRGAGSLNSGGRSVSRSLGSVKRGDRSLRPHDTAEGSGQSGPRIVLHGWQICLPVPPILVNRGVSAGQSVIGGRALLPMVEVQPTLRTHEHHFAHSACSLSGVQGLAKANAAALTRTCRSPRPFWTCTTESQPR
jgi:hypothetical protein